MSSAPEPSVPAPDKGEPDMDPELAKELIRAAAADVQALVTHYQQQHMQLQEEVAEFVIRDVEEQNEMHRINAQVLSSQQALLGDARYVRWAITNNKGEFAENTGTTASNNNNNTCADRNPNPPDVTGETAALTSWMVAEVSAVNNTLGLLPSNDPHVVACVDLDAVLPREVLDVVLGRRRSAEVHDAITYALQQALAGPLHQWQGEQAQSGQSAAVLVPLLNGGLLWPSEAVCGAISAAEKQSFDASIEGTTDAPCSFEGGYAHWWQWAVRHYWGSNDGSHLLERVAAALAQTTGACLLDEDNLLTVVAVPRARLAHEAWLCVRAYWLNGAVKAFDHRGPALYPFGPGVSAPQALAFLREHLAGPLERTPRTAAAGKHICYTFLVPIAARGPHYALATAEHSALTKDTPAGLVVDARAVSPALPFCGSTLSWPDIGGLARVDATATDFLPALRVPAPGTQVAALDPFDAATRRWFPVVNASVTTKLLQRPHTTDPSPQPVPVTQSSAPSTTTHAAAAAADANTRHPKHNTVLPILVAGMSVAALAGFAAAKWTSKHM